MKNAVGFGKPSVRNFFVYIIWLKIETLPLMPLCYHNVVKTEQQDFFVIKSDVRWKRLIYTKVCKERFSS